jgi:tetratricopeptide (TPR) repeat protein
MLERFKSIINKDIYDEQIMKDFVHFGSAKQISVEIINENIIDATVINNVTIALSKSFEYQTLIDRQKKLQEHFSLIPENDNKKRLKISAKINHQEKVIKNYAQDILKLAEQFSRIEINTARLRSAKEFFDDGKFAEARAVFETELEQMRDEQSRLLKEREKYETDTLPKLKNNAEEFLVFALATETDYSNTNRFEKTNQYFEDSIKSFKNKENLRQYAYFLQTHNFLANAHAYYHEILDDHFEGLFDWEYGLILGNLGIVHNHFPSRGHLGINDFEKALKIWHQINDKTPSDSMQLQIASTLNLISSWYVKMDDFEKALQNTEESLLIFRHIEELTSYKYPDRIAGQLRNLGLFNKQLDNFKKSEEQLSEALSICKKIKKDKGLEKKSLLSEIYGDLADLYEKQNNYQKARKYSLASLKILRELVNVNPNRYLSKLAHGLYNSAHQFDKENNFEEALKHSEEAHGIFHGLNDVNPDAYSEGICRSHEQLGRLYTDIKNFEHATRYLEKALIEVRTLVEVDSKRYSSNLGLILLNYAELKQELLDFDNSLVYFKEALEVFENLAKSNPKVYLRWLAFTSLGLGSIYEDLREVENALKFQKKALKIYRKLALENPDVYLQDVSRCLVSIGVLYRDVIEDNNKALKYFEESLVIEKLFAELNPQKHSHRLSILLKNLGIVYYNQTHHDKALIKFNESLKLRKNLAKKNQYYLKDVADIYEQLARAFYGKREFVNAIKESNQALEIYKNLVEENPQVYLAKAGKVHRFIGAVHKEDGASENAVRKYRQALESYQEAVKINETNEYWMNVADVFLDIASANFTLKNYFEAIQDSEEALEVFRQLAETDMLNQLPNLVNALAKLAVFYFEGFPQNEKSVDFAVESLAYYAWVLEENKTIEEHYAGGCMAILKSFDFNEDEIIKMVCEKRLEIVEISRNEELPAN